MFARLAAAQGRMVLGTNLTAPSDWSTELPFRNPFVLSRPWISGRLSGTWNDGRAVAIDANGWPTSLAAGQQARTLLFTFDNSYPRPTGTYQVRYSGSGRLNYAQGAVQVVSRAPGLDTIRVAAGAPLEIDLVMTNPQNPLKDIQIVCADDAHNSDPLFRRDFLDSLRGYQVLRFMEWQSTNGSRQRNWGDRPMPALARWTTVGDGAGNGGGAGVPLEVMIELANTLDVAPWFCIPHQASDAYVEAMAMLIAQRLSPSLPVAIEFSNEVWNAIMPQATYAAAQGATAAKQAGDPETWGDTPFQWQLGWYAQRAVQCFKIFAQILPAARLGRILGSQSSNPWVTEWLLNFKDTRSEIDAVAIAPYIGDAISSAANLDGLFQELNGALATIVQRDLPVHAQAAGKLPIVCYECGDGSATLAGNEPALAALVAQAAADPRMQVLYMSYLQALNEAGVLASLHYQNTEQANLAANQPGFGAQQYLGQTPVPPKLAALRSWMGSTTAAPQVGVNKAGQKPEKKRR